MNEVVQQYLGIALPAIQANFPILLLFTAAIVIYAILIYTFYRFAAARDIFGFNLAEFRKDINRGIGAKIFKLMLGVVEYGILLPAIVFIWFAGFSLLLFVLAKELAAAQVLLIAITIVSAIRVTAYYSEDLSRDVAKLLPFGLLAIAIVTPSFFSLSLTQERILGIGVFADKIIIYLLFAIVLEWILRVLLAVKRIIFGYSEKDNEKAARQLKEWENRTGKKDLSRFARDIGKRKDF